MRQFEHYLPSSQATHFVTGATGLLGSEYLYSLLTANGTVRCALLIRAKTQAAAESKVNDLFHYLFGSSGRYADMRKRVDVYLGDITSKNMGLNQKQWEGLSTKVSYIFHAASNSNLSDNSQKLNRVNVDGTLTVLNFAKHCKKLLRFLHVSSAYISGTKPGVISPDELDMKQAVSDDYQLSKRAGEHLVRKHTSDLPIVIIRPSTIVGHSINGRTNSYKALYYPIKILHEGKRIFFPYSKTGRVEAVPSDWVAKMALMLMYTPNIESRCFHLTMGDRAYSIDQIKRIALKGMAKHGTTEPQIRLVPRAIYKSLIKPFSSLLIKNGNILNKNFSRLSNYTCVNRIFENSDTFYVTGEDKHQLPGLEGYIEKLCNYAIEKNWKHIKAPYSSKAKRSVKKEREVAV